MNDVDLLLDYDDPVGMSLVNRLLMVGTKSHSNHFLWICTVLANQHKKIKEMKKNVIKTELKLWN